MSSNYPPDSFESPPSSPVREHNLEEHGPNNHLTLIYEDRAEQFATAIPFVKRGIERGDYCLYIADDNDRETVVEAMRDAGIDVEAAVRADLLSIQSGSEVYLEDGTFDPDEMIRFLEETVTEAIEERGHDHVRVTGEMTWVLNGEEHYDALAEYETKLNHFYPEKPVTGLCQYNRERFPARILHDVIRSHPQVVYEDTLSQNFFYNPPSRFYEDDFESAVDQRVETLLQQARANHSLAEFERGLSALSTASRGLLQASNDDVTTHAVRNVRAVLEADHAVICEYDDSERRLTPCTTVHEASAFDPERYQDRFWESFVTNEPQVLDVPEGPDDGVLCLLVVPLGRHGVLVVPSSEADAFDESDVRFASTVGANVEAALDRAERNAMLEARDRTVSRQNDLIGQLERLNAVVREVTRSLTTTSTHADLRAAVCDRLARTGSYEFVWFGDYDAVTRALEPRASAGVSDGYLDAVELGGEPSTGSEPAQLAAETRETHVVGDVLHRSPVQPWQREAFRRGFQSVAAVPVAFDGVLYGVVSVYAAEADAFDDVERTVLTELGALVGFGINAIERKQALVDDRVVELELRITDPEFTAVEFARETGATYDLHGIVPHEDGFRMFAAARGSTKSEMRAFADESLVVESADVVAERDDSVLFEYTVDESGFVPKLLEHGATPTRISADENGAEVVLSLSSSVDLPAFVQMLRRNYSGVEVVAKRHGSRDPTTVGRFDAELKELLTPRQYEALQTAYYSGFFDWPRESTGEAVAERMGISQPTFNRHLRKGSRKLFWKLFADRDDHSE